jgi:hypothetical protein
MTQPDALRLADAIDPLTRKELDNLTCAAAAAELRRLVAQRDELVRVLKDCEIALRTVAKDDDDFHLARHQVREVRAAIKKAEENT